MYHSSPTPSLCPPAGEGQRQGVRLRVRSRVRPRVRPRPQTRARSAVRRRWPRLSCTHRRGWSRPSYAQPGPRPRGPCFASRTAPVMEVPRESHECSSALAASAARAVHAVPGLVGRWVGGLASWRVSGLVGRWGGGPVGRWGGGVPRSLFGSDDGQASRSRTRRRWPRAAVAVHSRTNDHKFLS